MEGKLPSTLRLWYSQPQPHQMTPGPRPPLLVNGTWGVIRVRRPSMEHMGVAQELNVAGFQDHVQGEALTGLLQNLKGIFLCFRRRRDASVRTRVETAERSDVHGVEFGKDPRRAVGVVFEEEDAGADPLLLPSTGFAFAVKIPVGFNQGANHIGVRTLQLVEDIMRRHDVRLAARERLGHTEQANHVGTICVKELAGRLSARRAQGLKLLY